MCKATLLKSHFGIGVTPVNWLHIFRAPLWRAASVGLAIRRKRITDRKDWRKTEKVYLGETVATQTGNPHLYGRTEIRRQRGIQNISEKNPENFEELLGLIAANITEKDTNKHHSIPANVELSATIRYFATDGIYSDL